MIFDDLKAKPFKYTYDNLIATQLVPKYLAPAQEERYGFSGILGIHPAGSRTNPKAYTDKKPFVINSKGNYPGKNAKDKQSSSSSSKHAY